MTELDLFNLYGRAGVEPFENWETADLAQLEIIINAELQERARTAERVQELGIPTDVSWYEDL